MRERVSSMRRRQRATASPSSPQSPQPRSLRGASERSRETPSYPVRSAPRPRSGLQRSDSAEAALQRQLQFSSSAETRRKRRRLASPRHASEDDDVDHDDEEVDHDFHPSDTDRGASSSSRLTKRQLQNAPNEDNSSGVSSHVAGPSSFNMQPVSNRSVTGAAFVGNGYGGRLPASGSFVDGMDRGFEDRLVAKSRRTEKLKPADEEVFQRVHKKMWFVYGLFVSAFPNEKHFIGTEDASGTGDVEDIVHYMQDIWDEGIREMHDEDAIHLCTPSADILLPENSNIPYKVRASPFLQRC